MKPIVIIGAGMAGFTVARELRKLDKTIPLLILTADEGGFYSKPMLSNAFAQNKQAAQLVTQSAVQMAAQLDATIRPSTHVRSVDTTQKTIVTDDAAIEYDKLVLAVGAQPIRLAIEGDGADQVSRQPAGGEQLRDGRGGGLVRARVRVGRSRHQGHDPVAQLVGVDEVTVGGRGHHETRWHG